MSKEVESRFSRLVDRIEQHFELDDEEAKFVRHEFNFLVEAAKRQRSSDWLHTAISVTTTIAVTLALAPEKTKQYWHFVKELLAGFISLIGN